MATIEFSLPHDLGREGARDRLRAEAEANRAQLSSYVKSEKWSEGSVEVEGKGFSGSCLIGERDVKVSIDLALALRMMPGLKGKIEREARERLGLILTPANN